MAPIRIMLVDNNPAYVKALQESLERESDLSVIAVAYNGADALKSALCTQPDVLVTDLVMPVLDGFALMESLAKAKLNVRIIVLTELTRDCFIRQAMGLGASYYMVKPVDPSILCSRIRESLQFSEAGSLLSPVNEFGDTINPMLSSIGISPGTAGYRYLHFAIAMAARMENLSGRITTELYPSVARAFQTDQRNVERAIRHVIHGAWSSVNAPLGEKPTNGELIARLARQYSTQRARR
jgi:two-component system, response regulator, stage 0 sporulation protein A